MSLATSGSRPMMTNSPVPMAKPPTPSASTARRKLTGFAEGEETEMAVSALSSAGGEAFKAKLLGGRPAATGRSRILG
jgi:hypothetical protein